MSGSDNTQVTDALARPIRSVSRSYRARSDSEMNAVGYLLVVILAVLLFPLVPLVGFLWLIDRVVETTRKVSRR